VMTVMVYDCYVVIFMHRDILHGDWTDCLCMGRCVIGLRVEAAHNFTFCIEGNYTVMVTADKLGPFTRIVPVCQLLLICCIYIQPHPSWFYGYPMFV